MSDFLPQLAFLAVGDSIAPPLLLLTILFLGSQRLLTFLDPGSGRRGAPAGELLDTLRAGAGGARGFVGVGLAGSWLVRGASRRGWMIGSFLRLALLALALIAWALADQIGGNGFIAAFVGGLAVGPTVEGIGE